MEKGDGILSILNRLPEDIEDYDEDTFREALVDLYNAVSDQDAGGSVISTGRQGVIRHMENILGRELTEKEKLEYEDGIYEIGPNGVEYKGEWNPERTDGFYKVHDNLRDNCQIEIWIGQMRQAKIIISKKEYESINSEDRIVELIKEKDKDLSERFLK